MSVVTTNLGKITAYGDAVEAGYTGTKAEWQALMASYATVAEEAQTYASNASASATNASASATTASNAATTATSAKTAAETAQGLAETAQGLAEDARDEAQASADSITASATQIATNTENISTLSADITANINSVKSDLNKQASNSDYIGNTLFRNLLDVSDGITGYYRTYNDGVKRSLEGYTLIDYIPVLPSQGYYFENIEVHVCYFTENKSYISGTVLYNNSFTADGTILTPNNCAFMSISVPTTSIGKVSLVIGEKTEITIPPNDFGGKSVQDYISNKTIVRNLASNIGWVDGKYIPYSAGTSSVTAQSYSYTDAIAVEGGEQYCLYPLGVEKQVAFYTGLKLNTYVSGVLNGQLGRQDIFITVPSNAKYLRISASTASKNDVSLTRAKWTNIFAQKKIFEVGSNKEYTTILEALEYIRTNNINNAEVRIYQGTYDFINEIKTIKGNTYIDNYTSSEAFKGYFLGRNIHIKGIGNVVINCDYTPAENSDDFALYCSVFHVYSVGYTLENITVNAKGCRYILHDDSHSQNAWVSHMGEIANCHFVDNGLYWGAILGGGLYGKDIRFIHDCEFIMAEGVTNVVGAYYHTNNDSSDSVIRINNCYCEGCTFHIEQSGTPSGLATMYVSNCYVSTSPYEEGTGNIKLIQWNNTISAL